MDLRDCQDLARAFADQFKDDLNPYIALGRILEECGEVAAEIARLEGTGSKGMSSRPGSLEALEDEIADVLINLAGLANTYRFDLAAAMERKRKRFIARHGQGVVDRNRAPWIPPEPGEPMRVTVFCSSSDLAPAETIEDAAELGELIGARGYTLIYGGGSRGAMGALSRAAHTKGSRVHGIILDLFRLSGGDNDHVDDLHTVSSMWTRKRGLVEAGDIIVALPGGFGTFEELLEVLSLRQLGIQPRPVIILNSQGYYDPLLEQFARCRDERFTHPLPPHIDALYQVAATPGEVVEILDEFNGFLHDLNGEG